ncbi:DUF87 domain-containing protein [Candidatus Marsarchaeota archaeon]|nr:DUF87 domain-containing protein [Candidatus Marsarchaeota archaeon]MCL5404473.1 DUF87 domain-containing protein [Candidatus Marsarchaeota archaeon]
MIVNIGEGVDIDAQKVVTGRCCIIGQSGSGKSFLVGVFAEELTKLGLPFLLVDTEGEYTNIGKQFGLIVVGKGENASIGFDVDYEELFRRSVLASKAVIMDVSELQEAQAEVYKALEALYNAEEGIRKPYLVVIEEADKFAPQVVKKSINIIEEISVRGRKRGIGLIVATQRPANISKNVLAQCSYGFIGRLTLENDFESISILLQNRKRMEEVARLGTGEFLPFGIGIEQAFKVKARSVEHAGGTPSINSSSIGGISAGEIIAQLKRAQHAAPALHGQARLHERAQPEEISVLSNLHSRRELEEKLASSKNPISRLAHRPGYSLESIETIYVPFLHIKVMVPHGKGSEFYEADAVYDRDMREVSIGNGISVRKYARKKLPRLTRAEAALLAALRRRGRASSEKLAKDCGISIENAERALMKLEGMSLAAFNGKAYTAVPLSLGKIKLPETAKAMPEGRLLDIDSKNAEGIVASNYPGCALESYSVFYIPFYKAKLRSKNRIRVEFYNSLNLKEEKPSLFPSLAGI